MRQRLVQGEAFRRLTLQQLNHEILRSRALKRLSAWRAGNLARRWGERGGGARGGGEESGGARTFASSESLGSSGKLTWPLVMAACVASTESGTSNGGVPIMHSKSSTPSAHTSTRLSYDESVSISGAR